MSSVPSGSADQALSKLLSTAEPTTIPDVIDVMKSMDAILPDTDGLKWFNRMYQMVTEEVDAHPPGGAWRNPAWLERLDVVFAGFYFDSVSDFLAGRRVSVAWKALFGARTSSAIDRIQFALAGMNAHINHDLSLALLKTDADLNIVPAQNGPEHDDYESVNLVLGGLVPSVLTMLASDALGQIAQDTGKIGRILAYWNICRARDLAWDYAGYLRNLDGLARATALDIQDTLTGALGRAILMQA
jgi:Family of unknown function (DUF5995)